MPPITTIAKIIAQQANSQSATGRGSKILSVRSAFAGAAMVLVVMNTRVNA
jgi:hypothetical protein